MEDFDPTDGCYLIVAPHDDAARIETDMSGDEPRPDAVFARETRN